MNTATAIILIGLYISTFLIGRMVGIIEAKETILKIINEWEKELNK